MGRWRWVGSPRVAAAAVVLGVVAVGPIGAHASSAPGAIAPSGDAMAHLNAIVDLSRPPTYRRFGSPGMAAAADYAADVLDRAGYEVRRHEAGWTAWDVDYSAGHEPLLERTGDGHRFLVDSSFFVQPTSAAGITCIVRAPADVTPGDCGLVPFSEVSPEWKNPFEGALATVEAIKAKGGVGAILQGDVPRQALVARTIRKAIPVVVSPAADADIIGEQVRLRAMGSAVGATLHNVIGVRPPADPTKGYLLLQGHMDGFYEAAVDNGAGAAAVLAAAERLAIEDRERGLIVALYDGEEWGLLGSKQVAEDLASPEGLAIGPCTPDLHMGDIAAVVNLDAPSAIASDGDGLVEQRLGIDVPLFSWRAMVFSEEPALPGAFLGGMAAAGVLGAPISVEAANPVNGGVTRTDARWFHDAGLAVVWPVAGYPEYHTSADTLAAVDPADVAAVTAGAVNVIQAADLLPVQRRTELGAPGSFGEAVDPAACDASTPVVDELGGALPIALALALTVAVGALILARSGGVRHRSAG
jgi:hypothetical protein